MATKAVTITDISLTQDGSVKLLTWAALTNATTDDGEPMSFPEFGDVAIQMTGTLGAGGTVVWEGSNDKSVWATLNNAQGSALSLTALGVKQCVERPLWMRPRCTAGDGTTSLVVTALIRRVNTMRT